LSESQVNEEQKKAEEKKAEDSDGEDRGGGTLHKGIIDEPGWTADLVPKGGTRGLPQPR
jgi:hypothetical protein